MTKRPLEDEALSVGLRQPSDAAAQRAKPMFDRLVNEMRSKEMPVVPRAALRFAGGRRYDVALSLVTLDEIAAPPEQLPEPVAGPSAPLPLVLLDEATEVSADSALEPTVVSRPLAEGAILQHQQRTSAAAHPPPGAPSVRASRSRPTPTAIATEHLLEKTADTALLRSEADGAMAFDIAFNDDIFRECACTISVKDGRASAVFRVRDDNMRRLLESELMLLRLALEGRGLKVDLLNVTLDL